MGLKKYIKNKLIRVQKEKITIPVFIGDLLKGRTAMITGGSSGIGLAIARSFILNGANVILCGRDKNKLRQATGNLKKQCNVSEEKIHYLIFDISDIQNTKSVVSKYLKNKQVDIFVNNAGVNLGHLFPQTTEDEYDIVLNTNLKGMYFFSQIILDYMKESGIKGNLLNITSSSALRPAISPYILSKWGEKSLNLGLAKKYLPYGIIVNGLAPGPALTSMLKKDIDNDLYLEYSPSKRYISPEEVGNLATILVSDMGRMIVGDTIYATGGAGIITYDDMGY